MHILPILALYKTVQNILGITHEYSLVKRIRFLCSTKKNGWYFEVQNFVLCQHAMDNQQRKRGGSGKDIQLIK